MKMKAKTNDKTKAMREVCPGCGAPVDKHDDECRYCRRPYEKNRVRPIIATAAAVGGAVALALSVMVKLNMNLHLGVRNSKGSE